MGNTNRTHQTARRRSWRLWMPALGIALALGGCSSSPAGPGDDTPPTVNPGATLPLGSTVQVNTNGTYQLPAGAASLRTRCFGRVTVSYTLPGGAQQSNTCESNPPDGSANQTNDVSGVASVVYDMDASAFAYVTVQ